MSKKKPILKVVKIYPRGNLRCTSLAEIITERINQFLDDAPNCVTIAEIVGVLDMVKDDFKGLTKK